MSSSNHMSRRAALALIAVGSMLTLGGCFTPLYGPDPSGGPSMADKLSAVAVEPINSRIGVQLRNELIFGLTGGGAPAAPAYTLSVAVASSVESSIIDAETSKPQIDTVRLTGNFTLKDTASGEIVLSSRQFALTTYDRGLQRFAAVRAQRDAENRAATVLADQIKTQLAIHFAKQG
jgi:LPS-assembly lipoprotein